MSTSTINNGTTSGVTLNTPTQNTTGTQTPNTQPSTNSNQSTLTSATPPPAQSQSFCDSCCAWISAVVTSIRNCLAKIPCFSWCFKTEVAPTPPLPLDPDAEYVKAVNGVFSKSDVNGPIAPSSEEIALAVEKFKAISNMETKKTTFAAIYSSSHMTQEVFVQFYEALPVDLQNGLKTQIHTVHGNDILNDERIGVGFSDRMVHHHHKHLSVQQAVLNWSGVTPPQPSSNPT